jgi:preprotein translocase subunit YajC
VTRRPQAAIFFADRRQQARCRGSILEEDIVFASITSLAATSTSSGSGYSLLIFLVLMGAVFYFLLIRPQQRRQRSQRALIESVAVGDEVMTIGGIYGTVRDLDDESVTVEVAPGVDVRVAKTAIARKLVYDDGYGDEEEESHEGSDEPGHREAGEQS